MKHLIASFAIVTLIAPVCLQAQAVHSKISPSPLATPTPLPTPSPTPPPDPDVVAMQKQVQRIAVENQLRDANLQKRLSDLTAQKMQGDLEAAIAAAKYNKANDEFRAEEIERKKHAAELEAKVNEREQEIAAAAYANRPIYLANPLKADGTLVISDRRIALNGPITDKTADYVTERIAYFNNKDTKFPIFIVIDDSPGGSVMAGLRILEAMHGSQAPVYVVVKSFAASMAACITTLSEKSFAYPNAIILHHQISNSMAGNLTQQKEGLKTMEDWWVRLASPVAQKMGITRDQFIKEMYQHVSTGDWKEFGDQAAKLKWVDTIVSKIEETSLVKNPDASAKSSETTKSSSEFAISGAVQRVDEKGNPYLLLPRPNPMDCYYLYDPDDYYRFQ